MARLLGKNKRHDSKKKKSKSKQKCRPLMPEPGRHNINATLNKWSETNMQAAISEHKAQNGKVSVRQLARGWQGPRSTLQMRLHGKVSGSSHMSGRKPVLDTKTESDLVHVIKELSQRGFPVGPKEVRGIAYSYALQNGIDGFSIRKKMAGYEWLKSFLNRHPELSIRKPEPLSVARASGMNQTVIDKWFNNLESSISILGIRCMPHHFWNVDETGLQDYFVPQKVIGEVGKPCYQTTAGEKGETTTVVAAFNAMGTYLKPFIILRGKRLKPEWLDGLPEDFAVTLRMSDSGWITKELFFTWAELFVEQLPKDDNMPHVLFLDGHSSHVYNLDFINLMQQNNVQVWCFPAHTTHWLQPADRSFFRSLKHNWTEDGLKLARVQAAAKLSKTEFLRLLATSWRKSATVENAMSGFCSTGLFPVNRGKIPPEAYLPSKTSERTQPENLLVSNVPATNYASPGQHTSTVPMVQIASNDVSSGQPASTVQMVQIASNDNASPGQPPSAVQMVQIASNDNASLGQHTSAVQMVQITSNENASLGQPSSTGQMEQIASNDNASPGQPTSTVQMVQIASNENASLGQPSSTGQIDQPALDNTGDPWPTLVDQTSENSFVAHIAIPKRKRSTRKRRKMPSYELTSEEHMAFINEVSQKKVKAVGLAGKGKQRKHREKYDFPFEEDGHAETGMITRKKKSDRECEPTKKRVIIRKKKTDRESEPTKKQVIIRKKKTDRESEPTKKRVIIRKKKTDRESEPTKKRTTVRGHKLGRIHEEAEVMETLDRGACRLCGFIYSDPKDPQKEGDWIQCSKCGIWLHEYCAETFGVFDDAEYLCSNCL